MRPQTYTVSASAAGNSHSSVYVPDLNISPFNIGFGATIATTAKFTIQHTFQDPLQVSAGGLTWFAHEYVVAASANIDGNYAFPVAGIRVEASAANEGGVSITFIQAGVGN
jgi:hypothetical protein